MDITYKELTENFKKSPLFVDKFLEKTKYNKDGTKKLK